MPPTEFAVSNAG